MRKTLLSARAILIWICVALLSFMFAALVLIAHPLTYFFDRKKVFLHKIAISWARALTILNPWWKFKVIGSEHLPREGESVVYIANHKSQADILAVFLTGVQFRWLSKASVFKIPFVGWAMSAIGYVPVERGNRMSQKRCMDLSEQHLRNGISMVFFPEGTRSRDGSLQPFKVGAFRLAKEAQVKIVPIVLIGTENLLPKGSFLPQAAEVHIEILPAISTSDLTVEQITKQSFDAVASALARGHSKVMLENLEETLTESLGESS